MLSSSQQPPPYDIVLMDLQMPEMDGYQATTRLRAEARFATLPIIAMTAHATVVERERCLATGMNDHIAKPIDPASLFETVGRFYKPAEADGLPVIANLDTRAGLSRVAGNRKLYLRLLRQFAEQQGPLVQRISDAHVSGDLQLAERLAHTLKGVAGNIGATAVQSAAGVLEKLIRDRGAANDVSAAVQHLSSVLDPLIAGLRSAPGPTVSAPPVETAASADPQQSREAAARLRVLLSDSDPDASDFVEANQAALRPLFGPSWSEFEKRIQDYAFTDAQAQLEEALASAAEGH
jgi:two-component system, sensor histidine kinase and response regulator